MHVKEPAYPAAHYGRSLFFLFTEFNSGLYKAIT